MIKIDFEITSTDGLHTYRDALYLEDDNTFTEDEIQKMKQDRFDRWLAIITQPDQSGIENQTDLPLP